MHFVSKMKFLFLIFLCSCNLCHTEGSGSAVTFPGYKVVRFVPQNQEDVEAAKKMEENPGIVVLRQAGRVNQPMDVAIPPHMQTDFMSAARKQMPSSIMTENLESLIDRESMQLAMDESSSSTQTFEAVFTQYMPLEAVNQFIIQLQNLHPDMVNVSTYGESFEGRELKIVKIEREGGSENKHIMLMDGTTHAREWISTMQTIHFMNELCEQDSPEVNKILDNFVVFVVPVVNPDGYVHSWTINRLWRKNRSLTSSPTGCTGIDPNRNFDFGFGGTGSSADPCSEVYHGPFPLSAPETQALSEVISSLKPMLYLCMHSYSQMMLHSYGCSQPGEINEREAEHQEIADIAKAALQSENGVEYTAGNSQTALYEACGVCPDWALSKKLATYAFTYELRDTGTWGFLLPEKEIEPGCREVTAACKAMMLSVLERHPL